MCLALLALPACYSSRTRMPERFQTIAVPMMANRTYLDDYTRKLEVEVTEAVRKVFLQNGRLQLAGRESANLILEGDVVRLRRQTIRHDRYGDPAEVQLEIQARISLYDVKEARYILRNLSVTNDQQRTSAGTYDLRRGESEALGRERAVESLARNVARQVLDRW
jgi:hypothetical protein